jgi:hypothetical protein
MGSALHGRCLPLRLAIAAGLLLSPAFATSGFAAEEPPYCGMLPPSVEGSNYAGYGACWLHKAGRKPMWRGLARPDYRQQIRFTFTQGHQRYVRVIDFVEFADGTGRIETLTLTPAGGGLDKSGRRRAMVSKEDVQRLNQLAEASGTFEFEIGGWDEDELFMHCQTLDMERIDKTGYRSSSINISCHHPERLMPFVEHLTGLAGINEIDGLY